MLLLTKHGIIWLFEDQRRPQMSSSQELYNQLSEKLRELVRVKKSPASDELDLDYRWYIAKRVL
jgi:hypothetical protein